MIADHPVQDHRSNKDIRQAADIAGLENADTSARGLPADMRVDDDGNGDGGADPRTEDRIIRQIGEFTQIAPCRFIRRSGNAPPKRTRADARVVNEHVISIIRAGRPEDRRLPVAVSSLKIVAAAPSPASPGSALNMTVMQTIQQSKRANLSTLPLSGTALKPTNHDQPREPWRTAPTSLKTP